MVITDTFHGTIFSIINHIPFAVYCRRPQDVSYSNSEKLLDLLKKLNLTDRLITESNDLDTIFSKTIDFSSEHKRERRLSTISIMPLLYKVNL